MTAIEELIRTKLKTKLAEEKRRIAASLIAEITATPQSNAAAKTAKQQKITALQAQITVKQSKAAGNPEMTKALNVMKDKLTLMKAELTAIK